MQIAFIIVLLIHGLIHLFGFLKAFGFTEFNGIKQPISKAWGVQWLFAALLLVASGVLFSLSIATWWIVGGLALLVSQVLLVRYWTDAKFGTILNVVLGIGVLLSYVQYNFEQNVQEERALLLETVQHVKKKQVNDRDISSLPIAVQKWLRYSEVLGKESVSTVLLTQELELKLEPAQENWYKGQADQYFSVYPPAFNWRTNIEMNSFLGVMGRDKFEGGKGEMLIKLLGLIPLADVKNVEKVNQATLQRYLAEMVWFPAAVTSSYINWEALDEHAARATIEYKGTQGSGIFYFKDNGEFKEFKALRYKDVADNEPTEWTIKAIKTEKRNGVLIPTQCEAGWKLNDTHWTWLKVKITEIEYNFN